MRYCHRYRHDLFLLLQSDSDSVQNGRFRVEVTCKRREEEYSIMSPSTYASICAILCGMANFITWTGYDANVFISESVLHSVNGREPERIGAHDGYYGLAVSNAFYMISTLAVPSLINYFRSKWILTLSGAFFTFYFLSFQVLNRYLYFFACAVLGMAFSSFNVGYSGYLTEFSTRQTIERNQALSWAVSCFSVLGAGVVNFIVTTRVANSIPSPSLAILLRGEAEKGRGCNTIDIELATLVTTINLDENGIVSKYREYSDTEIRYFFAAFAFLGTLGMSLFAFLPNKEVEDNIAATVMFSVLFHKRVLILIPFYLYIGIFFSFWISIIPTTFQFTKALSKNVYIPAYFGITFTVGSVIMSILTMKMSSVVHNFSFKPLMIINAILHAMIYTLVVCMIPEWSTVRPNDEPSLLIQPSLFPVLVLAFLSGLADAANNTTRTVLSSLLLPTRRQQTFGASRFYHGLSASILFFISPYLSIYYYVVILSTFLVLATIVYLYTCEYIQNEERKISDKIAPSDWKEISIDEKKLEALN